MATRRQTKKATKTSDVKAQNVKPEEVKKTVSEAEKKEEAKKPMEQKVEEVKKAAEKKAEEVKEATGKKAEEIKEAAEKKVEEVKEAAEKEAEEVKEVAEDIKNSVEKKVSRVRKTVEKKAPEAVKKVEKEVKKTADRVRRATGVKKEIKTEVVLQYGEKEVNTKDMVAAVKKEWTKAKHKIAEIKSIELYVKPEEYAVYYVVNGDTTGKIWL